MPQQPVGVSPNPLPAPDQSSALNQEPKPTTSTTGPTIGSQTDAVTPQPPVTPNQETHPTNAANDSTQPSTTILTPGASTTPQDNTTPQKDGTAPAKADTTPQDSTSKRPDGGYPWVGFLKPLEPIRRFVQNPDRDWRPVLVWFGLLALIGVSMAVSVGSDSRGVEPLNKNPCNKTGVGFP